MEMLIDYPILLTQNKIIENSRNGKNTSPSQSVKSNCMSIVRKNWKTKEFQIKLPKSYWLFGEAVRKYNMLHTSRDGLIFVVKDRLIHLNRL